ncbi:NACHT domain-containing protein [Scytonema sp. UIC 10036]|uniref:NACHT domain-containing protein n=1 Tax=Scytonema sp. UIC 10036 TaxID=2304196 RepID=UPI0012DAD619|nr:NACHT domain-containing protein [Scytonema sp. UIC 10036]MUG94126.1 NACHT domain-containing protein [Scytonema sp. UIC 10036]
MMTETVATELKPIPFKHDIERFTEGFTGRKWVFEKIDLWLQHKKQRFFILTGEPGVGKSAIAAYLTQTRKDVGAHHFCIARQISTIEPNNVLLSLAAQLIKYFPDYGAALINTVKPLFLQVNVEIKIENIKDSHVQGVVINNLHIHYPKQALDIILRQALAALPKPPKDPILILIDSLDEAVTYSNENNLVTLLSNVDDLPEWVRFILTSRSDQQRVLSYFQTLNSYHYHLNELSEENKRDIYQYVEQRVLSERIQEQIYTFNVQTETFINQITELSKGNFLYTKVLLDDIELGGQPINNLAVLPKSLDELYHNFLLRLKDKWEGKYQPLFGILTVTKAPVTEEELANLLNEQLNETELRQHLGVVQQFLDVFQNERAEKTYSLFHQSLPEYLSNKEKSGVFYCSPKDGHRQIINYCWQYHPNDWRECDRYGLQYLTIHLEDMAALENPPIKAKKYIEQLHQLLATEFNGSNAWFDAKNSIGDTLGFVADVARAWRIAEKEFTTSQSSQSIVLQCRYALITSSINSWSGNLPTELVIELVKKDLAKGLPYFRQLLSNQQIDLQILSQLKPQALELKLVEKLLQVVEQISTKSYQAEIKSALAKYLPQEELLEILETIKSIENEENRNQALRMLLPYLSLEQFSKALEVAKGISNQFDQSQTLTMLPQYFQQSRELLVNVLERSKTFHGQYRADIVMGLARYLPEDLLPQALEIALDVHDPVANEYSRSRALSGLATAPSLSIDLVEKIQRATAAFQQNHQTLVLSALLPHLPSDQLDKILEKVHALKDESYKCEVLCTLASCLPSEQLHQILQEVQAFQDEFYKCEVLCTLASCLPSEQLHQILQEAQTFNYESHKSQLFSAIAPHLPSNQLYEILQEVQDLKNEFDRVLALKGIATTPNLTVNLIRNIQQQAEAFQNQDNKYQVLSSIATSLSSEQISKILQEAQAIEDDYYQTKTIRYLLAQLPSEQLLKVIQEVELLKEIQAIDYEYYQHLTLDEFTSCLPSNQVYEILQRVKDLENEFDKVLALKGIATTPNLTVDLIENIQQQAEAFQAQDNRIKVLSALATYLSSDQISNILQDVQASDNKDKAEVLSTLALRLRSDQLDKILQEIQALDDKYFQVQVLSKLAFRLPSNQLHNQLHKKHKAQVVSILKPHLPPEQPHQLLQEILAFEDDSFKALALSALVPHLPSDKLPDVLKITLSIENDFYRANALRVIAIILAKLSHADIYKIWCEMLHTLATNNRRSLLSDFRELAPVISCLGKDEAIVKICHSIKDIGRQWP